MIKSFTKGHKVSGKKQCIIKVRTNSQIQTIAWELPERKGIRRRQKKVQEGDLTSVGKQHNLQMMHYRTVHLKPI